jgi:DNA-binding transcriptional MocR family regulator
VFVCDNRVTYPIVTVKWNIVTMTTWLPTLSPDRPRYIAIADAIAADLACGKLNTGERLPPQRELAWRLGVTVGTVTRAYQEAERRGLLSGEVGRGSYLRDPTSRQSSLPSILHAEPDMLQMHIAEPPRVHSLADFDNVLNDIQKNAARLDLLNYWPSAGTPAYRQMGTTWLQKCGIDVSPSDVVVTAGAHAALIACLSLLVRSSDHVITEPLTYPTILPIARLLGVTLHAAEMDENGVVASSVEAAVRTTSARVLYVVPTLHNPTTVTLSEERRRAIAEIARRHDLTIIEDDIFRLLAPAPQPPTIYSLAPERTYYITSLSKILAPGLRVGFVATPPGMADGLALQQMIAGARVAGLTAEVARIWTREGTAERILNDIHNELSMRRLMALNTLGRRRPQCAPGAMFVWLPVPDQWRPGDFARAAQARGVRVTPGTAFSVGRRQNDHAIRVCLGPPDTREALKDGLQKIDRLLIEEPPESFRALA